MWGISTMEYYLDIKKENLTFATTLMELEGVTLNKSYRER